MARARYAVACFLLQAKDRHNGNILLDGRGRLVHIDFGFILEISPGGNMRFESAAFKLSHEMAQLLDPGGGRASAPFRRFQELCIRGFLAARARAPTSCLPVKNLRLQLHLQSVTYVLGAGWCCLFVCARVDAVRRLPLALARL